MTGLWIVGGVDATTYASNLQKSQERGEGRLQVDTEMHKHDSHMETSLVLSSQEKERVTVKTMTFTHHYSTDVRNKPFWSVEA